MHGILMCSIVCKYLQLFTCKHCVELNKEFQYSKPSRQTYASDFIVYQNLELYGALCIALIQPDQLSCLGSSVVEHPPSKRVVRCLNPT